MSTLVLQPTPIAQWHALVVESQHAGLLFLDEPVEHYLVATLVRFTESNCLPEKSLGLQYLESLQEAGHLQSDLLRDVGDQCLLYAGLFPRRAERKRVDVAYFMDLGRSAYLQLSDRVSSSIDGLYEDLAIQFSNLVSILRLMRKPRDGQDRSLLSEPGELHNYKSSRLAGLSMTEEQIQQINSLTQRMQL
jgi:hypothetical protein